MEQSLSYIQTNQSTTIVRNEQWNEKEWLVVPSIMMKEGVHNGSRGMLLHTPEELAKTVYAWENKPVTLYHPETSKGLPVSASSAGVLLKYGLGIVRNASMVENALKAEVWLEREKVELIPTLNAAITNNNPIDVSIGVFSSEILETGEWNGEAYIGKAVNMEPDHLALLPGQQGACSWKDGCGLRLNKEKQSKDENNVIMKRTNPVVKAMLNNAVNFTDRIDQLRTLLQGEDATGTETTNYVYNYLREVWDAFVIYEREVRGEPVMYYQRPYQIGEGGIAEWAGEPVQVERKVSYIQINNDMTETKKPCCPEKVTALINHAQTSFTEADRTWLGEQDSARLDSLVPKPQETPVINIEEARQMVVNSLKTVEDVVELAPQDVKDVLQKGVEQYNTYREGLVTEILEKAEAGVWTKEELVTNSTAMLEKLNKSFKPTGNYAGQAGNSIQTNQAGDVEPMLPAGV